MSTFSPRKYKINAKFVKGEGIFEMAEYYGGTTALIFHANDDPTPRGEVLSVNLVDYGMNPPVGHIYVRDYGQHEGLVDELVRLGVGKVIDTVTFGPFDATASVLKLEI